MENIIGNKNQFTSNPEGKRVTLILIYENHRESYSLPPFIARMILEMNSNLDPRPIRAKIIWDNLLDNWH
ncbi:MAG: hypothetical protein KatS3mg002_1028 [Candidatus Woesearchaeota archaeon]|jgi:hypothetical protein|nr:MAG: hypothetical protein KatS3mg002_1028 [Candidatus Woesearchaeota archaeon]